MTPDRPITKDEYHEILRLDRREMSWIAIAARLGVSIERVMRVVHGLDSEPTE